MKAPRILRISVQLDLSVGLRPTVSILAAWSSRYFSSAPCASIKQRNMSVLSSLEDGECGSSPSSVTHHIEALSSFSGKVVPLGSGEFHVRRVLPYMKQRSVGPFVFLDHFGPVSLEQHAMDVGPHPHIGLMTITYLYEGAILHRDSTGAEQIILPGEVNGMISGKGVTHSERGRIQDITPHLEARNLELPKRSHGLQLWMALSKQEEISPSFHHGKSVYMNENASLVIGQTNGYAQQSIPVDPYLGKVFCVDLNFPNGTEHFQLRQIGGDDTTPVTASSIEFGVYVSTGKVQLKDGWGTTTDGTIVKGGDIVVVKIPEAPRFLGSLSAMLKDTRVVVLGGTPLPEKRSMFWNFVATSREKIECATAAWNSLDRSKFPEVVGEDNSDSIPLPMRK